MRIKIVIDIWRDVFDFLSLAYRKQLARKFNKLGDREFSDLCQKWLHEWAKNVCFRKISIFFGQRELSGPFADVELPENVQTFEEIELWQVEYLMTPALHFLQRLQPLFHDVILKVYCIHKCNLVAAKNVLYSVLPLLSSIEMLSLGDSPSSISFLFTIRDFPNLFFGIKRLHIHLECESLTDDDELMELLFLWLDTRRADGQPRTLILSNLDFFNLERIEDIRQRFLNSTSPASFFIKISDTFYYEEDIQASTTQNSKTHELLLVRPTEDCDELLIGRCSSDELDGPKWMEEMDKMVDEQDKQPMRRQISVDLKLDWDSDEAESVSDEESVSSDKEEDVDQPGPSNKKAKLT